MTIRLPDDLDQKARELAEAEHRTMQSFIVNAVDEYIQRHGMDRAVMLVSREGANRYAEALDKLGKV
ncbi:MAG TPA: DUF1778 domain-containing protein [Stackebrandtia sp.]|jgi:predicted transcriptional regulator|uniref:type II toxin -antitoxin system TacA 1-like antitoxin n=1 Tax=Stackebrandtia sp. TaxID=2023065 RepID=UPI002D522647|nr:DUF1778 domain-containing protein [Stackebrandtia sp.]HZE37642.1 DUF1778 domain-containing protein [Stackebrandtia sp.]